MKKSSNETSLKAVKLTLTVVVSSLVRLVGDRDARWSLLLGRVNSFHVISDLAHIFTSKKGAIKKAKINEDL
jgi:hypothetical protein